MSTLDIVACVTIGTVILLMHVCEHVKLSRMSRKFRIIHDRYWNVANETHQINIDYFANERKYQGRI